MSGRFRTTWGISKREPLVAARTDRKAGLGRAFDLVLRWGDLLAIPTKVATLMEGLRCFCRRLD